MKLSKKVWVGYVICIGYKKNIYRSLFRKSEGERDVNKLRMILKLIYRNRK
jgi:hypothetical protein